MLSRKRLNIYIILCVFGIFFVFVYIIATASVSINVDQGPQNRAADTIQEVAVLQTVLGDIVFRLFPSHAPITVENFKNLIKMGHYNSSYFYRAEIDFCLQGGTWPKPSPLPPIKLEYNIPNYKGFVSMARGAEPDTASTEFSIMLKDNSHWLSPKGSDKYGYAVFAQIVEGWDLVEKIVKLPSHSEGRLHMLNDKVNITGAYLTTKRISSLYDELIMDRIVKKN